MSQHLLNQNTLITHPPLGHIGLEREADTGNRQPVRRDAGYCRINPDHVAVGIQQRSAGVASVQSRFCLKNRLALRGVKVLELRADGSGRLGPEPALFRVPDCHNAIADLGPIGVLQFENRKRSGGPIELE